MKNIDYKDSEKVNSCDVYNFLRGGVFPRKKVVSPWVMHCTKISRIELPETYVEIGEGAFCHSNLREFIASGPLTKIGFSAFAQCSYLEKLELPMGLKEIGYSAFKDCISLRKLVLPATLEKCGKGITRGCLNLRKVVLPEKCEHIIEEIRQYNPEIERITIIDENGIAIRAYGKLRQMYK